MTEVHQVRLVRCPNCRNLLQEHPRSSIYRCGACDSVLQAKKKVSVNGGGSLEDLGKEDARNDNSYRRKERFAKQRTVQLDANRSLEGQNSSHGNIAEDGPYPSQLERTGDSSWRVNRSRLSLGGASHGAYGSSHPNRPSKTSRLEQDQGLMWKLDELKEEVGMRSWPEKLRAKADCESTRPCGSYRGAIKHFHEPSYLRRYGFEPGWHPHRCEMNMQDLSVLKNDLCQARTSTSSGPFRPQPCRNCQPASHDRLPKKFMSADQEYQMPHHCRSQSNRPGCSCVHCDSRASPRRPSTTIPGLKGFPQNRMDPSFGHHANPVSFGPSRTNCSTESSTSHLQDEQSNPRHRSSMDSDTDSFDWYRRPTMRVQEPTGNRKRLCHPVADGAPFIVCRNCLELLRLPNVLNWRQQNNRQKLQCGACSTVLFLSIKNKKLRISLQAKKKQASDRNNGNISQQGETKQASDRDHDFSGNVTNKVDSGSSDRTSALSVTSKVGKEESGNADGSPKSEENIVLPTMQVRNESTGTERSTIIDSSPSLVGKEVEALEAIPSHKEDSSSSSDSPALPLKDHEPTIRDSDSHDLLNNASSDDNIDRVGEGNGGEVDEINVVDDKVYSELRSGEKDEMVSTEVDESFQEYLKSELSQEFSNEFSQNVKGTRISNGVHPYLVNVVMNSFKNLSMPSQRKGRTNEDPEVFVNGQPILQHQVAKAEKLAGPISPGNYWYDWQAGFWGVFGQPCLGILPPFIEEFIYPMPASCAAGNTAVFVNGRELHENDLELLSSKGLPTSRDKLYHVDFFGRVVDKDSGEEVANLGKLAPTVEKQNRGFGMRVPGEAL